jgi:hypothetical protein
MRSGSVKWDKIVNFVVFVSPFINETTMKRYKVNEETYLISNNGISWKPSSQTLLPFAGNLCLR